MKGNYDALRTNPAKFLLLPFNPSHPLHPDIIVIVAHPGGTPCATDPMVLPIKKQWNQRQ